MAFFKQTKLVPDFYELSIDGKKSLANSKLGLLEFHILA